MVNLTDDRPAEEQIAEFPTKINPLREGINTAIRADFWGYIAPADPRRAARIAYREVTLNAVKNGVYSSMFVAGALSAALSRDPSSRDDSRRRAFGDSAAFAPGASRS